MNTFKQTVEKILKQEESFLDAETKELNYTKVKDSADKIDSKLIALLADHKETKEKFFTKIKDVYVFNINDFKFFLDENKINNSYTQYANQIGLSDGADFLKDQGDVVLGFPYKDCVLEGGQSTEEGMDTYFEHSEKSGKYEEKEAKRSEVFFNQVLARDEIDRLFDKKALVNWKRHTKDSGKDGEAVKDIERSENGTIKENFVIKGNNLLALHSLKSEFTGKVKLIYIDPPYNTGTDSFAYNDNFNHSTWLSFMKNRLEIAKELLRDDGAIFVQCDDNEQAYLKVLMDEMDYNFLTTICVQMSYVSGEKMAHIDKKPPKIKEYVHFFTKNKGIKIKPQYTESDVDKEYNKFIEKNKSKNINDWEVVSLQDVFKKNDIKEEDEKESFMLQNADLIFNRVRNKSEVFKKTLGNKKLTLITTATGLKKYAWNGREAVFLADRVVTDSLGNKTIQQALGDIWYDLPIVSLYLEGNVELLGGKKPELLIKRIIDMVTQENDIVLDYHAGSGTTCAVAHKMNRQWIGIEQMDYIHDLPEARLKGVLKGEQTGISKDVNWKGGGSFIYCELAKWNEQAKEEINGAKDYKALEKMFDTLYEKYFFNYNVKIKEFKEKVLKEENFKKLTLAEQKRMFLTMLDLNQMYVQESEMADKRYGISKEDQKLTKAFYSK